MFSRLTPYAEEIIVDHQCGFRNNLSITDNIFFIREISEKIGIQRISAFDFIDFKKAYDSVKREVICNIVFDFGITSKLFRLTNVCLTEM